MVRLEQVSKSFGKHKVVDSISLEIGTGKCLAIVGTSGSGKTTLLKMINRLISPDEGLVTIDGVDISARKKETLRREIGYVLQRNSLFPHMTVGENIATVPKLLRWSQTKIADRANELLTRFHLDAACLQAYPDQFSGGEAQRINIIRAIIANPRILLMDEPFGALDTVIRSSIRRQFIESAELSGKTIIIVTHDVEEAFEMADVVCLMDKGKMVQTDTPAALLYKPATSFAEHFIANNFLQLSLAVTTVANILPFWDSISLQDLQGRYKVSGKDSVAKLISILRRQPAGVNLSGTDGRSVQTTLHLPEVLAAFLKFQRTL